MWIALLYSASLLLGQSSRPSPDFEAPTVGVLLKFQQKPGPGFVKQLRGAVREIFRPTGLDVRLEVLDPKTPSRQYDRAVVVDMHGRCTTWPAEDLPEPAEGTVLLGFTRVQEGEVIPFAAVDCDQIARVVAGMRHQTHNRLLLQTTHRQALARVLTHELLHVLLAEPEHHDTDCLRSPLRPFDLSIQPRLKAPEILALRQVGRPRGPVLADRPNAKPPAP
jgi:hypothetical protein